MENISLDDLELKRKNIKKNNFLRTLIGVVVLVISIVLGFATEILFLMFIGILAFAILLIINGTKKSEFTKHFKENIVRKLVQEELGTEAYYGKIIGRTSGRISNASFVLDNEKYNLVANRDNDVVLHGGDEKFSDMVYEYDIYEEEDKSYIVFKGFSKDGSAGYPGDIDFKIVWNAVSGSLPRLVNQVKQILNDK